jgi:hypothetical protein
MGREISPETLEAHRDFVLEAWEASYPYYEHHTFTHMAIARGEQVIITPTLEYWRRWIAANNDGAVTWHGLEMRVIIASSHTHYRLYLHEGGGIVAPVAEVVDLQDSVPESVVGLCSRCGRREPFASCVVCNLCLSNVWCSRECMRQDASAHKDACAEETANAASLVCKLRGVGNIGCWPFVVGILPPDDDRRVIPVPVQSAIQLPLLPTTVLIGSSEGVASTLILNNVLARRVALRELVLSSSPLNGSISPLPPRRGI